MLKRLIWILLSLIGAILISIFVIPKDCEWRGTIAAFFMLLLYIAYLLVDILGGLNEKLYRIEKYCERFKDP